LQTYTLFRTNNTMKTIHDLFVSKNLTLCVAESLTGGFLQTLATQQSWASDFFLWWITAYTREQKVALLWVDNALALRTNCVDQQIATMMAQWVCTMFGWTIWIATTWYASAYPAMSVEIPFAYYSIVSSIDNKTSIMDQWKIVKDWLDRVGMQQYVADFVWERLLDVVTKNLI